MNRSTLPPGDVRSLAPNLARTTREYLQQYRARFAESVRRGERGVDSARAFCSALDGLFGALYGAADATTRTAHGGGRVALVAVGGYGRGLVALHGDADVLLLADDPAAPRVEALAEAMLYPLWDIGFDIGHVVRGVEETVTLARDDIRTATTLLDLRLVAGDRALVAELVAAGRRQVFEPNLVPFLDAMAEEASARHARFGDSLYLLEPEVKLGRGGLRDLDIADWAGRAGFGVRTTEDLVRLGAYLPREIKQIDSAREMLWRIRNLLHLRAGRKQDRLTFADQEDIASELGFVDGVTLGVEQFMQAYYRHARVVAQTSERMLERARPQKKRKRAQSADLGDGTLLFDGMITFERTERLVDDPALALRLYRQVAKQGCPPYSFARDAVTHQCSDRSFRGRLMRSEEATQLFLDLVVFTGEVRTRSGSLIREFHETGILGAMVPEMEPLMGRVHHDVYHVYTVDVHTILAIDRLRAFFRGESLALLPAAARLAAEIPNPTPVFVAVLLHALGKARGGNWVKTGAELARPVALRLGLSEHESDHVAFLVREQGTLYKMATQRDTYDPEVISEVAKLTGTVETLRELFLVNAAILSTINPAAMTQWKAKMLDELLVNSLSELSGQERRTDERVRAARDRVRELGGEATREFLDAVPDRYLLGHEADDTVRHAELARLAAREPVLVRVRPRAVEDLTEVVVVTDDRPGLLAHAAAVLAKHRLAIVDAQIYTVPLHGRTLAFDIFHVSRDGQRGVESAELEDRIVSDLGLLASGAADPAEWIARSAKVPSWAQRRSPSVPTEVFIDNDVSSRYTVVDVFTRDRVGLLHVIANTLREQGLSISLSKVNTEGDRVADVFYVQAEGGRKLLDAGAVKALREALERRISSFHEFASGSPT